MANQLFANPDLCTGCNRCTYICSAVKTGAFQPTAARLQISNFPHRGYSVPNICFQCPKADCMDACPTKAFSRTADGTVVIDPAACIACGSCAAACTYGMVGLDGAGIAYKCDACGGSPACARECPSGALFYGPGDSERIRIKGTQMKNRSKEGDPHEKRQNLAEKILKLARD